MGVPIGFGNQGCVGIWQGARIASSRQLSRASGGHLWPVQDFREIGKGVHNFSLNLERYGRSLRAPLPASPDVFSFALGDELSGQLVKEVG